MKFARLIILALFAVLSLGYAQESAIPAPATPVTALPIPPKVDAELVKDIGNRAIAGLLVELIKSPRLAPTNAPREFAILPLERDLDQNYFTAQLRNEFTRICGAAGFRLYTPRETAEWDGLLKEIDWGQKFGDVMDPATVQKFGKFHGVAGLIRGRVVSVSLSEEGLLKIRVNCQAFAVETGEQIWGGERSAEVMLKTPLELRDAKPYLFPGLIAIAGILAVWKIRSAIASARRPR